DLVWMRHDQPPLMLNRFDGPARSQVPLDAFNNLAQIELSHVGSFESVSCPSNGAHRLGSHLRLHDEIQCSSGVVRPVDTLEGGTKERDGPVAGDAGIASMRI